MKAVDKVEKARRELSLRELDELAARSGLASSAYELTKLYPEIRKIVGGPCGYKPSGLMILERGSLS